MIESNYTIRALDLHGYPEAKPVKKEPATDLAIRAFDLQGVQNSVPAPNLAQRELTLENFTSHNDLYLLICSFLSRKDVLNFSRVCRRFHRIVDYKGRMQSLHDFALTCFWTHGIDRYQWEPHLDLFFRCKKIFKELSKFDFENFIRLTSVTSSLIVRNGYEIFFRILINSIRGGKELKARREAEAALVSEIGWPFYKEIKSTPRHITNSAIMYDFMKECGPFTSPIEARYYENTFRILIKSIRGGEESKGRREVDFPLMAEKARAFYSEIISTNEHITNGEIMTKLISECKELSPERLVELEQVLKDTFSDVLPFLIAFKKCEKK